MKEFSVQQYDVVIPRYLPFVQYTGTPGYSDVVSGNNWGMELNMNIQQNGNKYNLIYPKIIKYYEGMINYIGDISVDEYIKFSCDNKGKCCCIHHMKKYSYNKQLDDTDSESVNINNRFILLIKFYVLPVAHQLSNHRLSSRHHQ